MTESTFEKYGRLRPGPAFYERVFYSDNGIPLGVKRFDVLVIGSGMGGLCTAARLAEQGFRVLVIESAVRIGGRCSTYCRDGFKLATGVVGIERRGLVEDFFGSLGLPFDVRPADDLRILIGNKQVAVTRRGGMKRLLSAAGSWKRFPGDSPGTHRPRACP